ncbi:restriction endonuclease subunit S [Morganella morganii subsp. sibonii]|uniref:restriction endonuclease subunit S n=1 Tax=Morganella morganii TaxID=582 RepID=UPI000D80FD4B|nr:restriction endonuclease subunit S [Morganella morganii]ELB1543737.1 restriction endonuclease subunit S [Morganella morganii]SPX90978.1 Type I restriction enzyme EcoKI specificity protein [Morganella morganii]HDS6843036.1 restriction endonuclease subunit S [Morganella morganii subsp. morganii]HDS6845048.1 restriction endonuclease subunit S [Morganella morganii subsp. morganii]
MAKYKAYPEYKDSGVEWLGEIPEDWSVTKLKYIADLQTAKSNNSDELFVGLENISSGDGKYISKEESIADGTSVSFEKNDVLFGKLRPYLAKSWLATFSGVCSSEFLVLRTAKLHPKYLNYYSLTNEFIEQVNSSTYGSKMPRASWEFIGLLPVPTCSYFLSERVAWFLDHETAKIDNLIDKQQQLIELLKEKRQAVISHAVTKGLNPDVPMKYSGVEWLGEVPEHWVGSSLKYMAKVIDCKHITAEFSDVGIPVASISEVKNWFVDLSTAKLTNKKDYSLLIDGGRKPVCGDIIYSRNATVGEAAIVSDNMPDFAMGQDVCLIKTNEKVIPEFILYTLKSELIAQQLNLAMVGSTFKRINVDDIRNFSIAIPPKNEQMLIVKMLMGKLEKYDQIISNAVDVISYMQERRTALISAAVTGKIDVRDWVAPDTQEIEKTEETAA